MDELVLAIPAADCWNILTYREQGLLRSDSEVLEKLARKAVFSLRDRLEEDSSFKQLISYGLISCEDSFFLFKRISGQVEKRLHNMFSLGVGGHMNPGSTAYPTGLYLEDELKREIFEELRLMDGCNIGDIEFIGFINDDTIPVGRVHLGLLYNIRVSNKSVYINETDKMTAVWVEKHDLAEFYDGMETWSRIIFDQYIKRKI